MKLLIWPANDEAYSYVFLFTIKYNDYVVFSYKHSVRLNAF